MSSLTSKYNLIKPADTDYVDVADFNHNSDALDEIIGNLSTKISEFEHFGVNVTTLSPGENATASYSNGTLSLGIPRGDDGAVDVSPTVQEALIAIENKKDESLAYFPENIAEVAALVAGLSITRTQLTSTLDSVFNS